VYAGSEWTIQNLFWIDIALGPASGLILACVAMGRPRLVVTALESRAIRGLGFFSYSLYLIHAPIVVFLYRVIVSRVAESGLLAFTLMLLLTVPICLIAAKGFSTIFEIPFQRRRGWPVVLTRIRQNLLLPSVDVRGIEVETGAHRPISNGSTIRTKS
jgi:peptidoglycan/LPS O-acetylase OafA/YrhL